MVAMHPQTESLFFRLPAEIREKIQRFALAPPDENDLLMTEITQYPEVLFRTYEQPLPPVMCTCKKMYMEMSPVAFSEIIVHESTKGSGTRTGIKCHGTLRFERLRRVSMVVAVENPDFISPSWELFLSNLLKRSPNVDHLDIEFHKNEFREKVERELPAAETRRQNGEEELRDSFILKHYAWPNWLEEVARQPSLRWVSFEGNVPEVWLERLRQESKGRIQVFSDGVRFREKEDETTRRMHANDEQVEAFAEMENASVRTVGHDGSTSPHGHGDHGLQTPEFQIVYSRID